MLWIVNTEVRGSFVDWKRIHPILLFVSSIRGGWGTPHQFFRRYQPRVSVIGIEALESTVVVDQNVGIDSAENAQFQSFFEQAACTAVQFFSDSFGLVFGWLTDAILAIKTFQDLSFRHFRRTRDCTIPKDFGRKISLFNLETHNGA